ncbi:hypothetical protein IKB17_03025 [bacterium]|nr:hypothetical protein [bacterium]
MNRIETFKQIMEKSNSNRVVILTNHYQIIGNVYECDKCNKNEYINLTNVALCNANDIFDGVCESSSNYDWLHINLDKVVAYSFI